jgi:lincosamide nucleotidyltransferase A/C/D/E
MQAAEVLAFMRDAGGRGFRVWIAGGWAVDALVGRQTRDHLDLDVAVDERDFDALLALLGHQGYAVTTDWLPARVELRHADGRTLDLHPVVFESDGSGTQFGLGDERFLYAADGFTAGRIAEAVVPCLSAEQQLRFREGYLPRPVDVHDIALLQQLVDRGDVPI